VLVWVVSASVSLRVEIRTITQQQALQVGVRANSLTLEAATTVVGSPVMSVSAPATEWSPPTAPPPPKGGRGSE